MYCLGWVVVGLRGEKMDGGGKCVLMRGECGGSKSRSLAIFLVVE